MAKGPKRSNREHKKPKQPKATVQASPFVVTPARPAAFVPGKKR
jgi:hypothetical protein